MRCLLFISLSCIFLQWGNDNGKSYPTYFRFRHLWPIANSSKWLFPCYLPKSKLKMNPPKSTVTSFLLQEIVEIGEIAKKYLSISFYWPSIFPFHQWQIVLVPSISLLIFYVLFEKTKEHCMTVWAGICW